MKLCPFAKMILACFVIRRGDMKIDVASRIRMECNDSTSDDDKATEEEKEKKSVDFDCESGVHNRGMKSKW